MKKLTVEDLPVGYNYGAVDRDGSAYAFRIEPFISEDQKWVNDIDIVSWDFIRIGENFDYSYWKNSLVKRNEIPIEPANNQTSLPKLKQLKVDDIPEGYNYATVSTSGVAYVYENEPTINENIKHWSPNGRYEIIGNGYDATDWRNSLVCREPNKLKTLTINDIPDGFYYAAIDGNGDAIAYEKEPYLDPNTEWWCEDTDDTNNILIGKGYDSTSWRKSLIKKVKILKITDIPQNYNYAAVDSCGTAFAYKVRPVIHSTGDYWTSDVENSVEIEGYYDSSDWRNSLICKDKKSLTGSNYRTIEENNAIVNNQTSAHYQHQQPTINMKLRTLTIDDIPKGYYWAAVEPDGVAYAYIDIPYLSVDYNSWKAVEGSDYTKIGSGFDSLNWKKSLISSDENFKVFFENPTFSDIPKGFNYIAVDNSGSVYAYMWEPFLKSNYWEKTGNEPFRSVGIHLGEFDWKNSLVSRQLDKKILTVEDIPQGYNYAAVNHDGTALAFTYKPVIMYESGVWLFISGTVEYIGAGFDSTNWKNSLVCREVKEQPKLKQLTVDDIPDGFDYAVVDYLGVAFACNEVPKFYNGYHEYWDWDLLTMKKLAKIGDGYDATNWKESLVFRQAIKQLTSEDIPQEYHWAAVEPDGVAYAYKEMPYLSDDYNTWEPEEGSDYIKIEKKFDASNWRTSLISFDKNCKVFFENPTSDDIPEGYNYIAVDSFGSIYAFIQKPLMRDDHWEKVGDETYKQIGVHVGDFDWKNSLVFRPYNAEFKTLTVDDIPEGFNYAAIDFNSWAYAYVNKPSLDKNEEFWRVYDNRGKLSWLCLGSDYDTTDYKNSLVSKTKKPVLKKLTVDDIPEGYYYAASDSSGTSWAYQSKPKKLDHSWIVEDDSDYVLIGSFDPTDWQNSLVSKEEIVRNGILSKEVDCLKTNTISSFDYSKFNSVSFFDYGKINSNTFPPDNTKTTYNQIGGFITGISNSSNKTSSFDFTFIKVAEVIAERSKSTRLKVGAVLVKDNRIISTGYNGLVSGVQPDVLEDENGVTKKEVIHAELNCIISCARNGVSCEGSTLYLTHSPCQSCAALIAQSGIKKVIFKNDYRDSTGVNKLGEYGVKVIKLN